MHLMIASQPKRAEGFALITALVMLLIITVLALGGSRLALDSKRMSRNQRDRDIALQAAEAALRDAEYDITAGVRSANFSQTSAAGFPASGCNTGATQSSTSTLGLCASGDSTNPIWNTVSWIATGPTVQTVAYGDFTGRTFPIGSGLLPAQKPRYIIEQMNYAKTGADASGADRPFFYRITAVGWGPNNNAPVMLQSYYVKSDSSDPSS
ncbi:MAG: pilus assembly PilX family protein [Ralstonia sp.]|uniref:pilus assembly PilX family protein n=1 Tax=Ralstonia sp. TaxID=54061 RepID=UPI003F7E8AFF